MKTKSLFFTLISTAFFCLVSMNGFAADKKPIQLQLLGTTVGSGFSGGYHFNDIFFAGLDYSSISLESSSTDESGTVTVELDFVTQILLLRASPFSGSFYLQAGAVMRNWEVKGQGASLIGDSGQSGIVDAKVTFPSPAYNFSLGWNWIAGFGLSGGIGLGIIMGGEPDVELTATAESGPPIPEEEVEKEEKEFKDEMAAYKTFPYIVGTIGWNF